jgi:hypothetical protein
VPTQQPHPLVAQFLPNKISTFLIGYDADAIPGSSTRQELDMVFQELLESLACGSVMLSYNHDHEACEVRGFKP